MSFLIRSALSHERSDALALLFTRESWTQSAARVRSALEVIEAGAFDPAGVVVLVRSDQAGPPAGVVLAERMAGSGQLTLPVVRPDVPPAAVDALVAYTCAWLRHGGARLLQCLPTDAELALAAPLLRNGFLHPTGLSFLRHDLLRRPPRTPALPLTYLPYPAVAAGEFQTTLLRTYEGTLDCPEVNGIRSIEQVLAGHRAQGRHDPSSWWLVRCDNKAVAVLLLTEGAAGEWEISYVGVTPEARGRRVGATVVAFALDLAQRGGAVGVTLCVDDRNRPALDLYQQTGFVRVDHRPLLLALPPAGDG